MNSHQNTQPVLIAENLLQAQFIYGIYRLAGCLLLLDKKQRPYWKIQFSDVHGTVSMYMFTQPQHMESLGHGAFVELTGEVKRYGKQHYIEILTLKKASDEQLSGDFLLANLPVNYCHNVNSLKRLHHLISLIENRSLVQFIADIMSPMEICVPFFQAPASLNHHHNYSGGLLDHTVEVGEIVSTLPLQTQIEKELAITAAIFHDIGKVKSIDSRMKRLQTGQWVDHSALTLEICAQGLVTLEKHNSLFANILRNTWTCASPGARYGYAPQTAVAEAVQVADRFSAKTN